MSPELREMIERLRDYKMSPQEKFLQRVSFIWGMQDYDSPSPMTKRQIAEHLAESHGYPSEWIDLVQEPKP